jgi:hypothetical protein
MKEQIQYHIHLALLIVTSVVVILGGLQAALEKSCNRNRKPILQRLSMWTSLAFLIIAGPILIYYVQVKGHVESYIPFWFEMGASVASALAFAYALQSYHDCHGQKNNPFVQSLRYLIISFSMVQIYLFLWASVNRKRRLEGSLFNCLRTFKKQKK